jgi:hypothetical protein
MILKLILVFTALGVNRDFELIIDEETVNAKVLYKHLKEAYPDFQHSNILIGLANETKFKFEELSEDMQRFINRLN